MRPGKGVRPFAAGALLLAVVGATVLPAALASGSRPTVAATLPWWDPRGVASLHAAVVSGPVTEVSPMWGTPVAGGGLQTVAPDPVLDLVRRDGGRLLPTVQNYIESEWDGELVAGILTDPEAADRHRHLLVDAVVTHDWAGIDVDYGALPPTAGSAFVEFLRRLRDDLHAHDRVLSVTLPARVADEERGEALAYSYQLLGAVADQVRLRAHYRAWDASAPGPVAPLPWVEDVVRYAVERIPRDKLVLGLATYGYDWSSGRRGVELQTADAVALAREVGVEPQWDPAAAACTFRYERAGEQHVVWYEDGRSAAEKYAVAVREGLRGVAVWRLGGEDRRLWDMTETVGEGA